MKEQYKALFSEFSLNNGATLKNRFAMCPMLVFGADDNGAPTEIDLNYFKRRANVGGLLITGATTVSKNSRCATNQLTLADDSNLPAFKELAQAMKSAGNKAIVQLQHPGREAAVGFGEIGKAYAPSAIDFPFLQYPVTELTEEEIEAIIQDFCAATERLIEAGFDGVEIHGANHYLLQQFFSAYSNIRTDKWGGSLEKRMAFPLKVTTEVLKTAREKKPDFIVGYRLSPEEVHGDTVGYVIDDSLQLVDKLADTGLDYIHTSTYGNSDFGEKAYKFLARKGNQDAPMNELVYKQINGRTALLVSGSVKSADEALDALNYGDIIGMGVAALSDPDLSQKIQAGNEEDIELNIKGRLDDLALPEQLLVYYKAGAPFPPLEGLE